VPPPPPPPPPPPVPPPPPAGGYPAANPQQSQGYYPPAYPTSAYPTGPRTSGKAIAVMVLGIISLLMVCGYGIGVIPAIVALAMAPGAKREIAGSGGTVTGEGFVKAGVICSWITVGLTVAGIVLVVALLTLGAATSSTVDTSGDVFESGVGLVGVLVGLPLLGPSLRRLRDLPVAQPAPATEEN
jgi:hypothetical protein